MNKSDTIPIYWLVSLLPLLALVGAWTTPALANPDLLKAMTAQIYLSALLVFWCWQNRHAPYLNLHCTTVRLLFSAFFVFGSLSALWSVNVDFFIYKWLMWYAGALTFFFVLQINHTKENLHAIFNAIVLAGVVTSVIGIAQYLFLLEVLPQNSFPASTFGNGNVAGQVIVLCFPAGIYLFLKQNSHKAPDWIYALALALMLVFAFYTQSRGVWLAVSLEIVLIALFVLLDKHQRPQWLYWNRNKKKASLAALLLLTVLINFDNQGFQPFSNIAAKQISSIAISVGYERSPRYLEWTSALEMIKDNPFIGTGLGSFLENYNQGYHTTILTWNTKTVHNDLLELGVELGAVGYLIFIALVVCMIKLVIDLANKSSGPQRLAYAATFIALTGTMFNAQLSYPYQLPVPLIMLPLYAALIIKGAEEHTPWEKLKVKPLSVPSWFSRAALSSAAVLLIVISTINGQWFRAYSDLSHKIETPSVPSTFRPDLLVFHQELIPILRSLSLSLEHQGMHRQALSLTPLLLDYWPEEPMNTILHATSYLSLGNYKEVERLVATIKSRQPVGSYIAEYLLLEVYQQQGETDKIRDLYQYLASEPEDSLRWHSKPYKTLLFLSLGLKDYPRTQFFYDQYLKYFTTTAQLESNMAFFYMNTEQEEKALPHMTRALELDPGVHNAELMRITLRKHSQ